ncbi:MAG: YceI family protein [Acidobacteriaceae bacterium]|jgi:polyisoprenoid-binding protein YceI
MKTAVKLGGLAAVLVALTTAPFTNAVAAGDPPELAPNGEAAGALPPQGSWWIDSDHSFAYFGARHHVVGLVRGRFDKVSGTFTVSPDPAACTIDVLIDAASINTQVAERDQDLRGPAYFDVKKFPTMIYQGRGIRRTSENSWTMDGSLTMHGVTKAVPLTFTFNGLFPDQKPGSPARSTFHATAALKRADFGMGARDNLGELGILTAPDVAIEIDVEANAGSPKK